MRKDYEVIVKAYRLWREGKSRYALDQLLSRDGREWFDAHYTETHLIEAWKNGDVTSANYGTGMTSAAARFNAAMLNEALKRLNK